MNRALCGRHGGNTVTGRPLTRPSKRRECLKLGACRRKETCCCPPRLSLLVATIAGAVGSHALPLADAQALRSFETAVQFQFFHGLGVIAIALVGLAGRAGRCAPPPLGSCSRARVLFCGSIYARALGVSPGIVGVAPYGGVAFMVGWLAFAVSPWLREQRCMSDGMDAFRLPSGAPVSRLGQGAWQIGEDRRKRAGRARRAARRARARLEPHRHGGDVWQRRLRAAGRRRHRGQREHGLSRQQSAARERVAPRHDRGVRAELEAACDRLSRPVPAALARLGPARGNARSVHGAARPRLDPALRRQQLRRRRSRGSASAAGRRRRSRRIRCCTTSSSAASNGIFCRGAASTACR